MNKIEKLNLIDGVFSTEDAKDILMNIFSAKINFHQLKNFSSQERYGKDEDTARKRIPKLKNEIEKSLEIIAEAKAKSKRLVISSEINIQFSED
jgi:hypothetical protein